ncbi:hypothetical protein [Hamadaea flava]|uniref:hypothetical protein n=1 Tax=Hamadaea flava TaxID=1742688 RepID=UPI0036D320CA
MEARDELAETLRRLPAGARADLQHLIDRLDARLLARTTRDPHARPAHAAEGWWRQRLLDR